MVKNLPAKAGDAKDMGLIPGSGRSPAGGNGTSLQYFCLKNSMDRGAWWATVYRVAKSQTQLKRLSLHTHTHMHSSYVMKDPSSGRFKYPPLIINSKMREKR